MRRPGSVVERHAPRRFEHLRASHRPRRGGSPAARAGTSPCRRSPARCSGRAAGSRRRPAGRYCRSPSRDWRSPSPWSSPGCARSRPGRNRSRRCRRSRTAGPRRACSAAGTPVDGSIASGLLRGSATNAAQSLELVQSQRSRTNALVHQPFGDDDMRQRRQHRDIGAGPQRQVVRGLDMRRAHQSIRRGSTTISLRALAQPLLHARGEHRMAVGRIGADHHDHVGLLDRVEILRAGRRAERLSSGRSRSASGRRGRRCRRCCCRSRRGPASAPGRFPRWCSATT